MIIRIVTTRGTKCDTFGGPYCTYISGTNKLQAQSALEILIHRLSQLSITLHKASVADIGMGDN